ncbi:hypothetical protein HMPREF2779_07785 [Rothia sp. HMSC069C03]|jgi:carbohydrate binding family 6|uniref:beta/gamma crystallin-related protein n=1 Tax=Rothia TaxID=32207 RepID=UPI0008B3E538|nr:MULTISPECIES: beta/gamma crystallin-related protein [Rothia]OFL19608.1 hypothetical protein HMPREF2779_07785 [Rothia sp. HMSC069C03]
MKLYKALATAMVATAATMAAMPAGNAAVFYDWRNYNEAGGIYDTHGERYVPHLRDMNDRVSSIRSHGEHYVAFQDEDYQGFSFDINYRDFNSLEGFYEGRNWWNGDWNDKITSLRRAD